MDEIYLIRVTLQLDGETTWVGFLPKAGEPIEFAAIADAQGAVQALLDGGESFDLFDPWMANLTISKVSIFRASAV